LVVIVVFLSASAAAQVPWVIAEPVMVTQPVSVGDVIVVGGGSLTVEGVPEPGFQLGGNLWVLDGTAAFTDSVIQVMSTYHGQYAVATAGHSTLTIARCDYRVPSGVQHGLVPAEDSRIEVRDSDFQFVQFVPVQKGTLVAERLNGMFECVLLDDARLELSDIPRDPGAGKLWVWPTFPPGSRCTYSPPLPGPVASFDFPPQDCSGIGQSFSLRSCEAMIWPLLVREGAELTLEDVQEDNWMVVGLFAPADTTVSDLYNNRYYDDLILPLPDRTLRLLNAAVDTWNFYPTGSASLSIRDSLIGEIIAEDQARVTLENVTIDGSGGYFGINKEAAVEASGCTFTCDIQATGTSRVTFRDCQVLPYPQDPTGEWTQIGAFDSAAIHLARTGVMTLPQLGGQGAFAFTWLTDPPPEPPRKGSPVTLHGSAAVYSLDPSVALASWSLEAVKVKNGKVTGLGSGTSNVEEGPLGVWEKAKPKRDYDLVLSLADTRGRSFESVTRVPRKP
jgi:hypothetical protein